jgi:hypothetical protein
MAAPTSYTEDTFKAYLHSVLGDVASALGWTVDGGDYDEILNETLLAYGTSDIADATTIRKLRALGRVELWRQVMRDVAADYDFRTADGAQFSRSQIQEMAAANFNQELTDAAVYDDRYQIETTTLVYDDYYTPPDLEDDE